MKARCPRCKKTRKILSCIACRSLFCTACLDKHNFKCKNKKIYFVLLLFLSIAIFPLSKALDGYDLVFNETFEDNDITEWSKVTGSGTFSVSSISCARGTYCLIYTAADSTGILLNSNTSTNLSNSDNYIVKAYIKDSANGGVRAYTGITFNTNAAGSSCDVMEFNTPAQLEVEALTCAGLPRQGIDINLTAGTEDNWYWISINVSESNIAIMKLFSDDTESSLLMQHDNFWRGNMSLYTGKIGFFGYRTGTNIDNLLIYKKTTAPPAVNPSLVINTTFQNNTVLTESLTVYYNGTFTDATTDIADCSFFVNNTLNLSVSDLNLSLTQNFNFTPEFGLIKHFFHISCNNSEVNHTTGKYFYTFVTSEIDYCQLAYGETKNTGENMGLLALVILDVFFIWLIYFLFRKGSFVSGILVAFTSLGIDFILISEMILIFGQGFDGFAGKMVAIGSLIFTFSFPITKAAMIFEGFISGRRK